MNNVLVTIPLAVKFDVVNKNGFSIKEEVYRKLLESEHIQELVKTKSLFVYTDPSVQYSYDMSNAVGYIKNIDVTNRKALVEIFKERYLDCIDNYVLGTEYLANKENNTFIFDRIIGFHLVEKTTNCYNIEKDI